MRALKLRPARLIRSGTLLSAARTRAMGPLDGLDDRGVDLDLDQQGAVGSASAQETGQVRAGAGAERQGALAPVHVEGHFAASGRATLGQAGRRNQLDGQQTEVDPERQLEAPCFGGRIADAAFDVGAGTPAGDSRVWPTCCCERSHG